MKITLPEKVNQIITTLLSHGYEAYAVGGCVRDSLLGREADDWDITTSASPYEVKELFRRTIDTGIQHGTVTVMLDKEGFEVTTYRIDGEYEDGRHPKEVLFTKNLEEDLRRRDFTINAMAYNEQTGLVDIFGGVNDLKSGIIRCVGVAQERFEEDALRILRAYRFSAQLGFEIEPETRKAATALSKNLRKISAERIRTELTKLLLSKHPDRLVWAMEDGITPEFLPEWDAMWKTSQKNQNHVYNVGEHTLYAVKYIGDPAQQETIARELSEGGFLEKSWTKKEITMLRYAALLHDVSKPLVKQVKENGEEHFPGHAKESAKLAKTLMHRLKFDNETTDMVVRLVAAHNEYEFEKTPTGMRKLMHRLGPDLMEYLWELQLADVLSQHPNGIRAKLDILAETKRLHKEVLQRGDCVSLKELAVNGRDLMEIGIAPGRGIGEELDRLLKAVLECPELNQKEKLLALAGNGK
ncbi:MAG: CCA tRNA nucleotidyltransferase [Lachnospiraceae bacterium]|nr:CCA tRNA nucleotidyltransferase [Lachnospiraceae bacterium]